MTLRTMLLQRLQNDGPYLYPSLVPGGIYDRPLKDAAGEGGTPAAFYVKPGDPAKIRRLQPSIYLDDPNENPGIGGPRQNKVAFVRAYIHVPATADGKAALLAIDARILWLYSPKNWQPVTEWATPAIITALERTPALESEAFPGSLVCFRRFQIEYLRLDGA